MKKIINFSWCLLLVLGFSSCDTDDEFLETKSFGGHASLADRELTVFDTSHDLTVNLFTAEGVTVESVEIVQDGTVIGTATVSGETATFNSSILGELEADSYPITIRTTYSNGDISENSATISVDHAISLGDNPTETTMDSLSTVKLSYEVSTLGATVDAVTLSVKEGSEGTYQEAALDLSTEEGTVEVSEIDLAGLGIDLAVSDTLYYQFTATSGTLSDSAESYVTIVPKAFTNSNSATLSNEAESDELDLATGEISADAGEIAFLAPRGFVATDTSDISFVEVTEDFWSTADVLSAKEAYEAGVPVASVTPVADGEVYVYKVTRDTLTYYGVIKIGDVVVVNDTVVSFDVEYMEGR